MPHFIIDCTESSLKDVDRDELCLKVQRAAVETDIFDPNDIKIRIQTHEKCMIGGKFQDYIHVFAWIMEGRTQKKKAELSKRIVSALEKEIPNINYIAMNVAEFDKETYCNKMSL